MPLKAGTVDDFTHSMASAMESALAQEYQRLKGEALPDMGQEDRRMLFAAIAQGVVRHLKDNLAAFTVSVETTQVTGETGAPLIRSRDPGGIGPDLVQINASDNRIKTRGAAAIDAIQTEGVLY